MDITQFKILRKLASPVYLDGTQPALNDDPSSITVILILEGSLEWLWSSILEKQLNLFWGRNFNIFIEWIQSGGCVTRT